MLVSAPLDNAFAQNLPAEPNSLLNPCLSTFISVARFRSVPSSLVAATNPYRGRTDDFSLFTRMTQILQASKTHEFPDRWFTFRFGGNWENVLRTLKSNPKARIYIEDQLQRLERFVETDQGETAFQQLKKDNPQAYQMLLAHNRPWLEHWSSYNYVTYARASLPSQTFNEAGGIGIALDTNLSLSRDNPMAEKFWVSLKRDSLDFKNWILPEHMAEILDADRILPEQPIEPREYIFQLSPQELSDYEEVVKFFSDKRKSYEADNNIPSPNSTADSLGDDRLLAQAVIARGIQLFATLDQKLFNSLAVKNGQFTNKVSPFQINGGTYLSVDVQIPLEDGRTYSITVINAGRPMPATANQLSWDPRVDRDRGRSIPQ